MGIYTPYRILEVDRKEGTPSARAARGKWQVLAPARYGGILSLLLLLVFSFPAHAEIQIILKNSFIEQFKNRATIEASYTVVKAHAHPNPPSKDGDMHIAGTAPEVGLPMVAEIMNAAKQSAAVERIHQVEGTGQAIRLSGVWRLWCEHGGDSRQEQGGKFPAIVT
ncbi:MAG: hypothetical protein HYR55_09400 [Acidobacteria bacterium]|nr:hypothetical protein [Acidobacteriota bacterium]MBI3657704.1 hypothetical protein [Acidobacteriota bacterium]